MIFLTISLSLLFIFKNVFPQQSCGGVYSTIILDNQNWKGIGAWNNDEFVVQGAQHEGMSGGPVANGCGYLGMSHAVLKSDKLAKFAALIGGVAIQPFLDEHLKN